LIIVLPIPEWNDILLPLKEKQMRTKGQLNQMDLSHSKEAADSPHLNNHQSRLFSSRVAHTAFRLAAHSRR
jgi:hypothetical protein